MNLALSWILKIAQLVPIIAHGIQSIHGEKDSATKVQMASEALDLAVQGSQVVLPADQAAMASSFGQLAQAELAATVSALHSAAPTPIAAQ